MDTLTHAAYLWLEAHALRVALIALIAFVAHRGLGLFLERAIRGMVSSRNFQSREAERKREDTLIRIGSTSAGILIWLTALLMALEEVGVAIGPLLAAAGVAGLAFGFGGQYLIRDLISGMFIILENQYRIGDVVCFDATCGLVEDITLRMTTLRDLDGTVHHVPHGEVKRVSNLSKDYARVNLDVRISYAADLDRVIAVVNKVGAALAEDPAWSEHIVKAPQFLRVDDFGESGIVIKILGDTKPLKQWDVSGELRRRLKRALDKEKIDIPLPQLVIHQGKSRG
ncbi:MAG TPA: mechanosensitive ion channel family protein [Candidatus Paceibacterota bacterium]|nr:mechanosensitive ion channel family protein [Candidatus Paceibacterota bacterium]